MHNVPPGARAPQDSTVPFPPLTVPIMGAYSNKPHIFCG